MAKSIRTVPIAVAFAICTCLTAGCGGTPPADRVDTARRDFAFWRQDLLYLKPRPCERLLVEVDFVEGARPDDTLLRTMEQFLRKHCRKPGGIEISLSRPVPLDTAKHKPAERIALENIDGPSDEGLEQEAAFVYVLFYDAGALGTESQAWRVSVPAYPCAMYVDLSHQPKLLRHCGRRNIEHEIGHLLGLCTNPAHGTRGHCINAGCTMSALRIPARTWLLGLPPPGRDDRLCRHCLTDLQRAEQEPSPASLEFRGPFLVRREREYSVAACPAMTVLATGADPECLRDWRKLRALVRAEVTRQKAAPRRPARRFMYILPPSKDAESRRRQVDALLRARQDPYPLVRRIAEAALASLHAQPTP